jgi:hypothetical protein
MRARSERRQLTGSGVASRDDDDDDDASSAGGPPGGGGSTGDDTAAGDEVDNGSFGLSPPRLAATHAANVEFRDVTVSVGACVQVFLGVGAEIDPATRTAILRCGPRAPPALEATLPVTRCLLMPHASIASVGHHTGAVTVSVSVEYPSGPLVAGDALMLDPWLGVSDSDVAADAGGLGGRSATPTSRSVTPSRGGGGERTPPLASTDGHVDPGAIIALSDAAVTRTQRARCWHLHDLNTGVVVGHVEAHSGTADDPPQMQVSLSGAGLCTTTIVEAVLRSVALCPGPSPTTDDEATYGRRAGLRQARVRVNFGTRVMADFALSVTPVPQLLEFNFAARVAHLEGAGPQCILAGPSHFTNARLLRQSGAVGNTAARREPPLISPSTPASKAAARSPTPQQRRPSDVAAAPRLGFDSLSTERACCATA